MARLGFSTSEILIPANVLPTQRRILLSMLEGAKLFGVRAEAVEQPNFNRDVLVLWGAGRQDRRDAIARQVARGRYGVALDLGYWGRSSENRFERYMRVSLNAWQPQALVLAKDWPANRFDSFGLGLRNIADPAGHVVITGMTKKSAAGFGYELGQWEQQARKYAKRFLPGRKLALRIKTHHEFIAPGFDLVSVSTQQPISNLLAGASAVVTRHSNVAVDAIVDGVPCATVDGAAASILGGLDREPSMPDEATRLRFLRNLAWFQWTPNEAKRCHVWRFLAELIDCTSRAAVTSSTDTST